MAHPRIPRVSRRRWPVAYMPDLGELQGPDPERQHIVDHGFIRRPDGMWQVLACIRGCAVSRVIFGWEGASPVDTDWWKPMGPVIRADAACGERNADGVETAGSPFLIRNGEQIDCFFHSDGVHLATSSDGIRFERVIGVDGTSKAALAGGRDTMIMAHGGAYFGYVTQSAKNPDGSMFSHVICSRSSDLRSWSEPVVVSRGGVAGDGRVDAESPFVIHVDGYFYLFRTSSMTFQTSVYRSRDPLDFGIHDDSKYVCTLDIKISEIIEHDGRHYISDLPDFHHLWLHELTWEQA